MRNEPTRLGGILLDFAWIPTNEMKIFLYELKHKVRLSKTMCGIFYFRFRFVFKFIFLFNKMHALFDFKTS